MSVHRFRIVNISIILISFILLDLVQNVLSWDTEYIQLLDLVEELKENFYDVLGVEQTAPTSEIRKAYRRLSLKWHPDKNDADNAEEMFRKITSVHEVLKDAEKRSQYDDILVNGLPNWRQPVYYYRKVRKLGLLEMCGLLAIIITVGQYVVAWSAYWERRFTLQEVWLARKQKTRKQKNQAELNQAMEEEMQHIPKPSLTNLLIISLCCWTVSSIKNSPQLYRDWKEHQKQQQLGEMIEEDESLQPAKVKSPRVYIEDFVPTASVDLKPVAMEVQQGIVEQQQELIQKKSEWTEADLAALSKFMVKYPVGTLDRWEKIGVAMERSADDVTKVAKKLKSRGYNIMVTNSMQGITGSEACKLISDDKMEIFGENVLSQKENPDLQVSPAESAKTIRHRKSKMQSENLEKTVPTNAQKSTTSYTTEKVSEHVDKSEVMWSQQEQKLLEKALSDYPKGTEARWQHISQAVPGRSQEECIARYKHLAEMVKKKKQVS